MKKAFVVDECFQCPNFSVIVNLKNQAEERICDEKNRDIEDPFKIPKWCPLPDYIKKEVKP